MKLKLKEILDLLLEATYLLVIFFVPLSFSVWFTTHNIFTLDKIVVFRVLFFIFLFLTLIEILFFQYRENKNKLYSLSRQWLRPFIFIVGVALTLFFSIDISQSWWGSYLRQAGFINYILYFLWFVLLSFNLVNIKNGYQDNLQKRINRIINTVVGSGFIIAVYGILQILNIDFFYWTEAPYLTHRVFSTLGQPNFLASFLLLIIPLSVYLLYRSRLFWLRFLYLLVVVTQIIALFLTSSRGALVALFIMVLAVILYLLFKSFLDLRKKILTIFVLIIIFSGGLLGVSRLLPGRFSSLLDYRDGSVAARLNFYRAASEAISKKPIFGYGLETGNQIFIKYYQADWAIQGDVDATTDHAHNIVLDILLTTGFWGLMFFVLLYYSFFSVARKNIKDKNNGDLSLALSCGVAAYLISLLFSFSIIAGEVYFWLFFALLIVLGRESLNNIKLIKKARWFRLLIALILLFALIVLVRGQAAVLEADHYFGQLYYNLAQKNYVTSLVLADYIKEEKISPPQRKFYNDFLGDKLSDFYPQMKGLAVKALTRKKLEEILINLPDQSYQDFLAKAKIETALKRYNKAETYFTKVSNLTAYWPRVYLELARMFTAKGDATSAIIAYHLAEVNLPSSNNIRLKEKHRDVVLYYRYVIYKELAGVYEQNKDYKQAVHYYQKAYQNYPHDFTLLKKIADSYYLQGNINKALEYNKRGFSRSPHDYNWPLAIAVLYQDQGNNREAIKYLNQAIKLAPQQKSLQDLKRTYK